MAREIAEVIRHTRSLAQRFEAPETVSFRAEWHGLEDSVLMDPNHPWAEKGTGATDRGQLLPMVDAAAATGGQMSAEVLAEAGYCNEADLAALESRGIRGHVALSREGRKHAANDRDRRPATHWLGGTPGDAAKAGPPTPSGSGCRKRRRDGSRKFSGSVGSMSGVRRRYRENGRGSALR